MEKETTKRETATNIIRQQKEWEEKENIFWEHMQKELDIEMHKLGEKILKILGGDK